MKVVVVPPPNTVSAPHPAFQAPEVKLILALQNTSPLSPIPDDTFLFQRFVVEWRAHAAGQLLGFPVREFEALEVTAQGDNAQRHIQEPLVRRVLVATMVRPGPSPVFIRVDFHTTGHTIRFHRSRAGLIDMESSTTIEVSAELTTATPSIDEVVALIDDTITHATNCDDIAFVNRFMCTVKMKYDGRRAVEEVDVGVMGDGRARDGGQPETTEDESKDAPSLVNIETTHQIVRTLLCGVESTFDYMWAVLQTTLALLKKPAGVLLFVYILAHLFSKVIQPICWMPGIASTHMCSVPLRANVVRWADYKRLSQLESATFEQLLDEAADGTSISLNIKKAEMAVADLIVLVVNSELKGRDALADHLRSFVRAAKSASRGLTRLNSRMIGAVDSIIAVNDHTLRTIEAAVKKEESALNIFHSAEHATQQVVAATFDNAMKVLSRHMTRIVMEAEIEMRQLDELEEMLLTMHEIVTQENEAVVVEREELLAQLWTKLGRNRRELDKADFHLGLLRQIGQYRMRAAAHVAATLQALAAMSDGMEDLRERVTSPELMGDDVPVEVHLKSIQAGLDRLTATKTKAQLRVEDVFQQLLRDGPEFGLDMQNSM